MGEEKPVTVVMATNYTWFVWVDETAVDEIGVDKTVVGEIGVDEPGKYHGY